MAWDLLPVDYTDAAWVGLKRYNQIDNEDGTISLQDVTVYSNKEKSFFGAKDANRMNEALNTIMSMVENGTDLYAAFQNYFADQKDLFEAAANVSQEDFNAYIESLKADADTTIEGIKTDYAEDMQDFQNQQEELFQLWFDYVKGQLGQDVAGNLLNEIIAVKTENAAQQLEINEVRETADAAKAITDTKGQANGLATLDDTGKLVQMPTLADIGAKSNDNLLDNWYFADPIDQRGGYVIPPGVGYYIPGSWEQAGTTSGYVKVIRFWSDEAQDYPIISVDGTEYVLYPGNAVRGYTGAGYGVVRWIGAGSGTTLIESGFLRRIATNDYDSFLEFFEPKSFLGKNCTYSILAKWDGQGNQPYINVYSGDEVFIASAPIGEELNVYSCTFTFPTSMPTSDVRFGVGIVSMAGSTLDIYAAKLELGDKQTLAHQDANGNWILNDPPPNKLIELLKCQYFYRLFATESARPKALADYHPPMRVNPTTGTIDINGVTYYYADANL